MWRGRSSRFSFVSEKASCSTFSYRFGVSVGRGEFSIFPGCVWNRNPAHPSFPVISPLLFSSGFQAPLSHATSFPVSGTEGRLWDGSPPQSRELVPVLNLLSTSVMHTRIFPLLVGEPWLTQWLNHCQYFLMTCLFTFFTMKNTYLDVTIRLFMLNKVKINIDCFLYIRLHV